MAQVGHGSITITDLTDTLNTQHFWWTADGEGVDLPGGAYITEVPIKEFKTNPTGGNLLTRSNGVWLKNGLNILASFTSDGLAFYDPYDLTNERVVAKVSEDGFNIEEGIISFEGDYLPVIIPSGETPPIPSDMGWYEVVNNKFVLTNDAEVVPGKVYYRASNGCITLSDHGFNREIAGPARTNLALAIGDSFAVDATGILYANGAILSGELTISQVAADSIVNNSSALGQLTSDINELNDNVTSVTALATQVYNENQEVLGAMSFGTEEGYVPYDISTEDDPAELGLYELINNSYVLTEDTSPIEGKTYYEKKMLPVLQITASSDTPYSIKLTNSELQFLENNIKVASISNQSLDINDARIVNKLQFGLFAFIPRGNGNLSLKYIGE